MISLKNRNKGFTIVELLIVIVVIGILALLVITTYSGIQAKARNAKRASDMTAVQTQLEAFFQDNGYYPTLTDLQTSSWLSANLKNLDPEALIDPQANPQSISSLSSTAGANHYAYAPTESNGSGGTQACTTDGSCTGYTLTATYEGTYNGQTAVTKQNLD